MTAIAAPTGIRRSAEGGGMSDTQILARALRLVSREVGLRESARTLELNPDRRPDAVRLFALASLLRAERLRLLVRVGLLERPIE